MKYKHYKGGIYEVVEEEATHSETGEALVIYRSSTNGKVWARPAEMFHGNTTDGKKRFTKCEKDC